MIGVLIHVAKGVPDQKRRKNKSAKRGEEINDHTG
jgi:hypothetical protein